MDTEFNSAELNESYAFDSPATPWWAFQLPDPRQLNEAEQYIGTLNFRNRLTDRLRQRLALGWTKKKTTGRDEDDGLLGVVSAPVDDFTLDLSTYYNRGEAVAVYDDGDGEPYFNENENYQADYNLILDTPFATGDNTALIGYEFYRQAGRKWGKYGELDATVNNHAVYFNDVLLLLNDDLVLSGGVRHTIHDEFGGKTTGKIGVAYTFQPAGTTPFANYGTSFRAPAFFQLFDPKYGNPDLGPEDGWTVEAGLRQVFLQDRVQLELIFWHTELDNVIDFVRGAPGPGGITGTYLNRDKGQTEGIEFIGYFWLTKNLRLNANYTYTDSWSEKDGERFRTVQIADHQGNFGAQYTADRFSLGGNLYATGPRLRWNGDREMQSYARVDVWGRVEVLRGLNLYTRIENLFDEDIEEGLGYQQPGIYGIVGVEWNYGAQPR